MQLPLFQVDAFTDRVFGGNPAAVMPLDAWLADSMLQAIADENHLSETAFFIPSLETKIDFELRWFTPQTEVPLCGHATLATAHVLFRHLNFVGDRIRFSTKSGRVDVALDGDHMVLGFPALPAEPCTTPPLLVEALGVEPLEVFSARSLLVVLSDEETVRALQPNMTLIAELDAMGVIATAPADDEETDFVSRYFAPRVGIPEDPVTGSAHCTSAPYWAKRLGKSELRARQTSARGGHLHCRIDGDRVLIGGTAVTYLEGIASIPGGE